MAAVSSELVENQDSTMAGRDDLGLRPHQQDRRAQLAHARDEEQEPRRDQAGPEERHGDGAQPVAPRGAAHLRGLLERAVDLEDDARDRPEPERQEHGEVRDQQEPERAVDRDREDQPRPQHPEGEDEARHRLREHQEVLDDAGAGQPRAVDQPREEAHQDDADARRGEARGSRLFQSAERTASSDSAVA